MSFRLIARPSSSFAGFLLALLSVITVVVPIPIGPGWKNGVARPGLPFIHCFTLEYAGREGGDRLPSVVRLTNAPNPSDDVLPNWYVAEFGGPRVPAHAGSWRWIASDSVELRWHHSPSGL